MKKQLIVISDMEGASGIFDDDLEQLQTGGDKWREFGREKMTSDVLAVCEAANEFGIDEILYYDGHFAGRPEYNTILEKLPSNVKVFDTPDRCFYWRRIRGQAEQNPFGIITVGQHARNGETDGYHEHTIQSPPIKSLWLNGLHIAEIGTAVLSFQGVKYLANIGCEASRKEAKELSGFVEHISVKDKSKKWEPGIEETYPLIKEGVRRALENSNTAEGVVVEGPYKFRMELCKYFYFDKPEAISWKGEFYHDYAVWEAPSVEIGLEILEYVRKHIKITDENLKNAREEIIDGSYSAWD